eukprot:TRINITY_DN30466_c0_g1_i3.p1 TRINITY_DN30466_c0_g1~~TRINITY_DN30466_c0_g1_i3.p1  ORF type:complete len:350 (-),score=43.84 TRINITY_DN30466_c0_g1_i3:182-1231(-)
MILEKTHTTYSQSTDIPSFSKTRARAERAARPPSVDEQSKSDDTWYQRTTAANVFVGLGLSGQVLDNSVHDYAHRQAVRDFVASNGGNLTAADWSTIQGASANYSKRAALSGSEALRSSVACLHFETIEGMMFTDAGVDVPLDKKIVAYRGRIAFAPNQEYDFTMGYVVFYHNVAENSIDLYFGFSHIFVLADGAQTPTAALFVGNADGASWPKSPEGRPPSWAANYAAMSAYKSFAALPGDYEFLYKYREDVGCPDSALDFLRSASQSVLKMVLAANAVTMAHFTMTVPCAVEYLRPDNYEYSATYGRFESLGFMHFMMELPPTVVAEALAAHIDWNTIDGVEISKPH